MTFKQFTAFHAVARFLNVTQAAGDLHISQSAISKQLKMLQEDYRVKLYFKKPAGGIELTDEGRIFHAYVQKILDDMEALKKRFNKTTVRRCSRRLTVGGTYGVATDLLPFIVGEFGKTHPKVSVTVRANSRRAIQQGILKGDIELAVLPRMPTCARIQSLPYCAYTLVPFVAVTHPLARTQRVSLDEFIRCPLVVRGDSGLRGTAEMTLRSLGHKPQIAMRCDTPEGVLRGVSDNVGVGILSYDSLNQVLKHGEFKLLHVEGLKLEGRNFIVYRKDRLLSVNAEAFLDLLKERQEECERRVRMPEPASRSRVRRPSVSSVPLLG